MSIRKSAGYQKEKPVFAELESVIHNLGGIIVEDELLSHISSDKGTQHHIHFLLMVGESFKREKRMSTLSIAGI